MPRLITKRIRAARRADAEERQARYDALSLQERLDRAQGVKERVRLTRLIAKEAKAHG